jgi:hypothetical protein
MAAQCEGLYLEERGWRRASSGTVLRTEIDDLD